MWQKQTLAFDAIELDKIPLDLPLKGASNKGAWVKLAIFNYW